MNERVTENIVRDHFRITSGPAVVVTEQDPGSLRLRRALSQASKTGGSGPGRPEFILTEKGSDAFAVVVECKANTAFHQSPRITAGLPPTLTDVANYAVDGVLHYLGHVSKVADVVGVAVSGTASNDLRVSTFRQVKGSVTQEPLLDRFSNEVTRLLPFRDYLSLFHHDPTVLARSMDRVMSFSRDVHNFMRDYAKSTEAEKPLIVSAILLALQPTERYNSLHLTTWAVEVVGRREDPDDPVVLKVEGSRGTSLVQSIRQIGLIAEPLTSEQRQAVQAATRDYGPAGPGYWRRYLPEWTRRELLLARLFAVSRGTERCMVFGETIPDTIWVAVCDRPRWHRGAHRWQRFSVGTLTAQDPGPPDN